MFRWRPSHVPRLVGCFPPRRPRFREGPWRARPPNAPEEPPNSPHSNALASLYDKKFGKFGEPSKRRGLIAFRGVSKTFELLFT
jgi:hypothetical protein